MKKYTLYIVFIMAWLLACCDGGDILEKSVSFSNSGKIIKLSATLSGVGSWNDEYDVALAGYTADSKYAVLQRVIPSTTADGTHVDMILNNVSRSVHTVELVITNRLRERILTLASIPLDVHQDDRDTIRMNLGEMNVDLLGSVQYGIFGKACVKCHGENGRSAAGLNLTKDYCYDMLVNQKATTQEGILRVKAGDSENSLLSLILQEGNEDLLRVNHTEIFTSEFKNNIENTRFLIDKWIQSL